MKIFKIVTLSLIGIMILSLLSIATLNHIHSRDLDYQMEKLKNGSLEEKMAAIDYIAKNKVIDAIPLIMYNVDNYEKAVYKSKNPESLSCYSTLALEEITSAGIGNSCCSSLDCRDREKEIPEKWKQWYKNTYKNWLKNQGR